MDMNTISQNTILGLLLASTVVAFCMAAREDYNMDVLDTIPDEVYDEIVSNLGEGCNDGDIVDEYMGNKEHYDSLYVWR